MSDMATDCIVATYTGASGDNLVVYDWLLPDGAALRGKVLVVHGLGEHAGRYGPLAQRLNDWGFDVRAYDQYGHGQSDGPRGGLPDASRLLDDLADLVESARRRIGPGIPLLLLGHSMGGLVAAAAVAGGKVQVDGLVLSSPALGTRLNALQKMLLALVPRLMPDLAVGNGLPADALSHDPAVVAAYRADPLVHDRVTGRLARFIADQGPAVLRQAPAWQVPTLLLYAGDDRLVDPAGSRAFAASAPADVVTAACFDSLWHEIFNEPDPEPVVARLRQWLDARF